MAKKGDTDLDNIDLDDFDFDVPEWNDNDPVDDKSRSPAQRITSGALMGAKDEIVSVSGVRKALSMALPSGYGLAADTIENVASDARSLYDKVASEQGDLIRGSKGFGRKAMQSVGNRILPKKLADRLNSALEDHDEYRAKSADQIRREQEESDIAALTEIFRARGLADETRAQQDDVDKLEAKALEQARFKSNIQALTSINRSMARLVGYQDKVTARYQQKMLELTYRQYASTRQLTEIMSENMTKHSQILEKIRHNTALPEAVKIRGSEMFGQLARQRLMGAGLNTVSNFTANYGKQVLDNVSGMAKGILNPISEAQAMAGGMDGIDKHEMGGRLLGSTIGSTVRDYASLHLSPLLQKNKAIAKGGEKLRGMFTGLPQRVNEYAKSETKDKSTWRGVATQMFKDFLPKFQMETGTGITSPDRLDEMATFDKLSRRSLIEIIPGYLSEIAHWTRIAVTGDKDSEKQVFNVVRGGFTSEKDHLKDVSRQIISRSERESLRGATDNFMKEIGGDTMSGRAQRVLKQKILEEIANGNDLVPARLAQRTSYPGESDDVIDEIVALIQDTFNIDEDGKPISSSTEGDARFNDIRDKFLNMTSMVPAMGDRVRVLSDVFGMDVMRKLGYVERNKDSRQDNINPNKFWSTIFDDDNDEGKGGASKGGSNASDHTPRGGDNNQGTTDYRNTGSDRARRTDDMVSNRRKGNQTGQGLEQFLGDKSTLITILRESRDFHAQTVELLKEMGYPTGSTGERVKVDWSKYKGSLSETARKYAGKGKDTYKKAKAHAQDLWIMGMDHPTLQEWKLKAGHYKDEATGKTIKVWDDIQSNVTDTRGKVVAYYEDIMSNGVIADNTGKIKASFAEKYAKFKTSSAGQYTSGMINDVKSRAKALDTDIRLHGGASAYASKKASDLVDKTKSEGRKFKPRLKRLMKFFTGGKAGDDITSELTGNHEEDMLTLAIRSTQLQYQTLKEVTVEKVRKGSYLDMFARRKELMNDAKEKAKGKYDQVAGLFGKGGALAGLASLLGRNGADGEDGESSGGIMDSIGDFFGGGGDEGDRKSRKDKRRAKRKGKLGKLTNWGGRQLDKLGRFGKAVKLGGKGVGLLGRAAWGGTKLAWKLGRGTLGLAGRVLSNPVTRMVAGTAGRMAIGALVGAAGLVSAPVLLVGGAVLTVAAGAALIYNLSRDELPPLSRVRMAQYGIKPRPDTDNYKRIMQLEKLFQDITAVDSDGKATVNIKSLDMPKVGEIFNINMDAPWEENGLLQSTIKYIETRFSPVFTTHLSNYHALTKNSDLSQIDSKLTGDVALGFLDKVAMKDRSDMFNMMAGPFEDDLEMDAGDVEDTVDDARKLIKEAAEKEKNKGKSAAEVHADGTRASIQAATTAAIGASAAGVVVSSIAKQTERDASGKNYMGGGKGSTTAVAENLQKSSAAMGGTGVAAAAAAMAGTYAATMKDRDTGLDDGKPVRYRIYGLMDMAEIKVGHLSHLEAICFPMVTYDAAGQATLKDTNAAYTAAEKIFAPIGKDIDAFYVWFHRRFTPVFLAYCTEVRARANIDAAEAAVRLKPNELLEVLRAIVNTKDAAGISVWDIGESPWSGYFMNDNQNTVKDALYALSLKVKDKTLTEPSGQSKGRVRGKDGEFIEEDPTQKTKPESATNPSANATAGSGNGEPSNKEESGGLWGKVKGWFSSDSKAAQQGATSANGQSVNASTATGATAFPAAAPVNHPGGGTGGNINDIPQPKGDGWENNRDTIIAAANMVGVDPALASSIAGVESNYRPAARPWSKKEQRYLSSAAGYYQVINGTWDYLMGKYGAKYGINPNTTQMDPRANALLGLEYIRENIDIVGEGANRAVTDTDVYLAHFLGPSGAKRFVKAPPGDPAISHVSSDQANANKAIFYDGNGRPRTVAAVYEDFNNKLKKHRKSDAQQIAATLKGGGSTIEPTAETASGDTVVADTTTTETPSMVKPASDTPTVSTASANTVADATAPASTENVAEKAEERQVQNTAAPMAVSARTADTQSSAQTKATTETFGGLDKGVGRLISVNESQLEQLVTMVGLLKAGVMEMPNADAVTKDMQANAAQAFTPSTSTPRPAAQSTVSVGRV